MNQSRNLLQTRYICNLEDGWQFRRECLENDPLQNPDWNDVTVPHDFCIDDLPKEKGKVRSGPFDKDAPAGIGTGYTLGGLATYRRQIGAPLEWEGKRVRLLFDGVYMDATICLNGKEVGRHFYGYTAFWIDLSDSLIFGAANELTVSVKVQGLHTRWYSGAGIFRPVHLVVTEARSIRPWGLRIQTPTLESADVRIELEEGCEGSSVELTVQSPEGAVVSAKTVVCESKVVEATLEVPGAVPWSPESPTLYRLSAKLFSDRTVTDEESVPFGFRTVHWDSERGFILNGHPIKLRGGCIHHDNGCLGACAFPRAEEKRVEVLKDSGFNAVRTAHNPPSTHFLDACDRLGMLVIDEAFDQWELPKNPNDSHRFFADRWKSDIDAMVLRDYNHPSVVFWSIGNEIMERADPRGVEIASNLAGAVRALDASRPITAGICHFWDHPGREWLHMDPAFQHLDVGGYNYKEDEYEGDRSRHPQRLVMATESFPTSAFDSWIPVEDHSWVLGDFVWTALDYIGEAGIGKFTYPSDKPDWETSAAYTVAGCGDIDLTWQKRPQSHYRDVLWRVGSGIRLFVDSVPEGGEPYEVSRWGWPDEQGSWTWPGTEGRPRTVRVYTRHPHVELRLNGAVVGRADVSRDTRFTATFQVPYQPGTLEAGAIDVNGTVLETALLSTTGPATTFAFKPDRSQIAGDGRDLSFVIVEVVDENGARCPNAFNKIKFQTFGPITIAGLCNGDIRSTESFRGPVRRAWRGSLLAVVRSKKQPGEAKLFASADGLGTLGVSLDVR